MNNVLLSKHFRVLILLFCNLIILNLCLQAQVSFQSSDLQKSEAVTHAVGLLHSSSGNLLYVRRELKRNYMNGALKDKCAIDVYTPDLKLLKKGVPQELNRFDAHRSTRHWATEFGGSPTMVFLELDDKENHWNIYRALINDEGQVGEQKKIGSVQGSRSWGKHI